MSHPSVENHNISNKYGQHVFYTETYRITYIYVYEWSLNGYLIVITTHVSTITACVSIIILATIFFLFAFNDYR